MPSTALPIVVPISDSMKASTKIHRRKKPALSRKLHLPIGPPSAAHPRQQIANANPATIASIPRAQNRTHGRTWGMFSSLTRRVAKAEAVDDSKFATAGRTASITESPGLAACAALPASAAAAAWAAGLSQTRKFGCWASLAPAGAAGLLASGSEIAGGVACWPGGWV